MRINLNMDAEQLQRALSSGRKALKRELQRAGHRGALELAREAREQSPKASTRHASGIQSKRNGALSWLVTHRSNYGAALEQGSGPGGFPSAQVIIDWMRVRGIQPATGHYASSAYLIARAISQRGTRAQPHFAPAEQRMQPRVQQLIDQAVTRALDVN